MVILGFIGNSTFSGLVVIWGRVMFGGVFIKRVDWCGLFDRVKVLVWWIGLYGLVLGWALEYKRFWVYNNFGPG